MRKTKIVCTLGPSTDDEAVLRELILSGMNVARLNMSHGTHEEHKRRADMVKKLRKELDVPVAILLDTKGPEIRTGKFAEKVMLTHGQKYTLTTNERPGDAEGCSITFKDLPKDVHRGSHILIDDGLIEMVVEKVTDTDIECRLLNDGPITSYKGINVPGVTLSMPYISEKDRADLEFCVKEDFEFIAASFTRSAEDIVMIRNELEKNNCRDIRIIAKIENTDGVEKSIPFALTTGDIGMDAPEEQYLSRLTLRLDAEVPSRLEVSVSYDGGPWEKLAEKTVEAKRQSIDLPFVPRRCGTLRLRLEGAGQITLRGLAKTMAKAQGGIFAAGKEG